MRLRVSHLVDLKDLVLSADPLCLCSSFCVFDRITNIGKSFKDKDGMVEALKGLCI